MSHDHVIAHGDTLWFLKDGEVHSGSVVLHRALRLPDDCYRLKLPYEGEVSTVLGAYITVYLTEPGIEMAEAVQGYRSEQEALLALHRWAMVEAIHYEQVADQAAARRRHLQSAEGSVGSNP